MKAFKRKKFGELPIGAQINAVGQGTGWLMLRHEKIANDLAHVTETFWRGMNGDVVHITPDTAVKVYTPEYLALIEARKERNNG